MRLNLRTLLASVMMASILGASTRAAASDAYPSPLKLSLISEPGCAPALKALLDAELRQNPRIVWRAPTQAMSDKLAQSLPKPTLASYDLEALLWVRCAVDGTLSVERYTRANKARSPLTFAQAPTTPAQARELLRASFEQVGEDVLRWRRQQRLILSGSWAPWPELTQLTPIERRERAKQGHHYIGGGLMWAVMSSQEGARNDTQRASAIVARYSKEAIDTYKYDISYNVNLRLASALLPGDPYTSVDGSFWAAGALMASDFSPEVALLVGMGYQSIEPLSAMLVRFGPAAGLRWRLSDWLLLRLKSHITFNPSPPVGIGWAWGVEAQAIIALGDRTNLNLELPYQVARIERSVNDTIIWTTLSPTLLLTRSF